MGRGALGWKRAALPTPAQGVAPHLSVIWDIKTLTLSNCVFVVGLFFFFLSPKLKPLESADHLVLPGCEQGQEPEAPRSVPLSARCDLHRQNGSTWTDPTPLMDGILSPPPSP